MLQLNNTFLKIKFEGYGATHYRITITDNIENAEWLPIPEDYQIEYTLPNQEGIYTFLYQFKNPYNTSEVCSQQMEYISTADPIEPDPDPIEPDPTDTETPSIPTNLVSSNITQTSLTLTWTASTDNVGIESYEIFQNNISIGTVTTPTKNIIGLTANTSYAFKVRAKDAAGNYSGYSSVINVTTSAEVVIPISMVGNVVIAQIFAPSSTIINIQDAISIDSCFVTLYNKGNQDIDLSGAKLFWKYDVISDWHKVNLSGTIKAGKHFLIKGSKVTGVIDGTNILSDWEMKVPDLDCSVNWNSFVDPDPTNTTTTPDDRKVAWALTQNYLFVGSKTGVVYLTEKDETPTINPFLTKSTNNNYVDMVGLLGNDYVNDIAEAFPISGAKKTLIFNRKKVNNIYVDTDNNSADFESTSTILLTSGDVMALIKNSES